MIARTPPAAVLQILRKEVGFGCPVAGCRKPFLTWHHFDPPWNEKQHHDPDGMIALCRQHHDSADRGVFSKEEMRALKCSASMDDDVKAQFPWAKRNFLIRLGGLYCGESSPTCLPTLAIDHFPIIRISKNQTGLLLFSLVLRDSDGTAALAIDDNMFCADPDTLHDLEIDTGATKVKAWLAKRDVGLELSFGRITLEQLSGLLIEDKERADKKVKSLLRELPPAIQAELDKPTSPFWLEGLPEELRELYANGDPVGYRIRKWATSNCLDDEQRIPLLNITKMVVHHEGRRIVIQNGIREGEGHFVYSAAFDNGGGALNL